MPAQLPQTIQDFMKWTWDDIAPYGEALLQTDLNKNNVDAWLQEWTQLSELLGERYTRLEVATTQNTEDKESEAGMMDYLRNIYPEAQKVNQKLKQKLLASGLQPAGFEIPLRKMQTEVEIFAEANLPLVAEEQELSNEYNKITGAQTVNWQGEERTIAQMRPVLLEHDRSQREQAWRLIMQRHLADRTAINEVWAKFLDLRLQKARNAGFADYRSFRWKEMRRFDYTPDDCYRFHAAIETAVVPAAKRVYEKRRRHLGLETLRPWDLDVDAAKHEPLRPFATIGEMEQKTENMLRHVDPELGGFFATMRHENLLDLDNRKNKAPGGYCTEFAHAKRPFIFMNAVGLHDDVQTLLHEAGHCFHVFETVPLPYVQQKDVNMEFAEVASMSMELLASPYFSTEYGGFYSEKDAARARIEHLEGMIKFWPYMAVVDAFQQWVYENHDAARNPANCDAKWGELWDRFMVGIDWSSFEDEKVTGWHRKLHIHLGPFYYVEYGLAQLGAAQVWNNSLHNQTQAVADYRRALSLGGTASLRELYAAAGAKLAFDADTLGKAVELIEKTIGDLEHV